MEDFSEEDKERLCGNPRDQQESARRDGQHQERAEMMIVTLTAKGTTSFFHAERAYPASSKTVKSVGAAPARKKIQAAATIATAACCSPQNAVNMDYISNYASGKPSLPARRADLLDQAFVAAHY
jgi:hypothetical protein